MNNVVNYKKCKKCGAQIPFKAKKCQFCGKSQGNNTFLIAFATIIACFVFIGAFSSSANNGNKTENENTNSGIDQTLLATSESNKEITFDEIKSQAKELVYKDVMRNPGNYKGQYFYITVKARTLEKGSFFSGYDRAYKSYTNDKYNTWYGDMIYLLDNRNTNSDGYVKILEDDIIKVYGRFDKLVETKNVLNNTKGEEMALQVLYVELLSE